MKRDSKGRFVSAKPKTKYRKGTFGYWWTVTKGNGDIQGNRYEGSIDCSNNKLTSLEGAPEVVDGSFWCHHNKLTSLEGAPEKVGGTFYCEHNKLTSLEGAPKEVGGGLVCSYNPDLKELPDNLKCAYIYGDVYQWRGSVWSFFDGVQKEVAKVRKSGALTVYTMKDGTYCVHDGEAHAHGATLKEAKKDLLYKRTSRDLSEFKKYTLDTKLSLAEAIRAYRSITGACSLGTKEFCAKRKLKKAYTIREIIDITKGAYGNEVFSKFFFEVKET